ncbi:MAG: alpha amylase C-terminal domain-containing protein [Dermatophilaceae bacterium]
MPTTPAEIRSPTSASATATLPRTHPLLVAAVNFSGQTHESYRLGVPRGGRWRVVLDTAGFHPDAPSSAGIVLHADDHGCGRTTVCRQRHHPPPVGGLAHSGRLNLTVTPVHHGFWR